MAPDFNFLFAIAILDQRKNAAKEITSKKRNAILANVPPGRNGVDTANVANRVEPERMCEIASVFTAKKINAREARDR